MKLVSTTAFFLLLAFAIPEPLPAQLEDTRLQTIETKDRLPEEMMAELVGRPMSLLRSSGLVDAQRSFDGLVSAAVATHGKGSVQEADLLTSFGVLLYIESFEDDDPKLKQAALGYLQKATLAYKAAFGARHPEVAVALNSYADVAIAVDEDELRPAAESALEEAYAIRAEALGPDNAETRATSARLDGLRGKNSSAASDAEEALSAAIETLQATAALQPADSEELSVGDLEAHGLWKPISYYDPLIDDFRADAERLERQDRSSRKAVAAKYGLTVAALDELIRFLRDLEKNGYDNRRKAGFRTRALRLVETGKRAPIVLTFAAAAIDHVTESGCTAADFDLLMKDSRNRDADLWGIAASCASSGAFATAIDRAVTARPALSYLAINWTRGNPACELAATEVLLRPEYLKKVDQQQRDRVHADVARFKLAKLLDLGLLDEALAFGDSLSPGIRNLALRKDAEIRTSIAGVTLKTSPFNEPPTADYAAALALAGRSAEAMSVLDLIAPAAIRKEVRDCLEAGDERCAVGHNGVPLGALIVDQLLATPNADPYALVETDATDHSSKGAGVTEVLCRLLSRPHEQEECRAARQKIAGNRVAVEEREEDDRALWAALQRAGGQPFESARSAYAAKLAALGPVEAAVTDWSRDSVDPAPVPFRELPLTAEATSKQAQRSSSPKALAPLPAGFRLVRVERSGQSAAAISLSQRFDPNGEVTAGGYWLHLSEDGGKTWQAPLYTGLAEHFPYVVPNKSRLPMLAGDRIQLEVEEALIDTASITYPPIGTRLRRKRRGIYLDIPIDELREDSDDDGITDIAARHLLLDSPNQSGTPFIVGTDRDCSAPTAEMLARLQVLKTLFQVEARALIEPVGRKGVDFGSWRRSEPSDKPPLFLVGNARDYRCVAIDRLAVVYNEGDLERLRKFSPDFQLIDLPAIRWNRDRTRGFLHWNMGWVGGTYRLVREGGGWKLESISEWIT